MNICAILFAGTTKKQKRMRTLTEKEIETLEAQGCRADDWTAISVDEDFDPQYVTGCEFCGEVSLGQFSKNVNVDDGFQRHSGIHSAMLNNVSIGDNCLIDLRGGYISNYDIGDGCCIINTAAMVSSADATYGEGNQISVPSEAAGAVVTLYRGLTSQIAAIMISDGVAQSLSELIAKDIANRHPERAYTGFGVKISDVREIRNTIIDDGCEIAGATRVSECTVMATAEAPAFIGANVIIENSIIQPGGSVLDAAIVENSLIGEACHVGKGASVESSLLFANSYIDNGEVCASFCGPYTVSHHKSTLLIGGIYSFFNAGSATNFSNHAYKMGPLHWGTMERGAKTASGAHLLWPASVGAFSMCMGKIQTHPDIASMPFSYVFGDGRRTVLLPGRNLTTAGTWRDVHKWPVRDHRAQDSRMSVITQDWLSPAVIANCADGMKALEDMLKNDATAEEFAYGGCVIRRRDAEKGIGFYDMAIRLYIGRMLETGNAVDSTYTASDDWTDLGGLLMPCSTLRQLLNGIASSDYNSIDDVNHALALAAADYEQLKWEWTCSRFDLQHESSENLAAMRSQYAEAHALYIEAVEKDAEREFALGDVSMDTLDGFLNKLKGDNQQNSN